LGKKEFTLDHSLVLAQELGSPHRSYPCIHVAGSNGKGSVSLKIATALKAQGHRVGLYTSPHLLHFSERILIDGTPIDEASLEKNLALLFAIDQKWNLNATFFELATQLAFLHFFQKQVDVAVIETGLGGRLDATNIIDPILTVITSISLEHTALLGNTLEAIAAEKAGILKPSVPCVIGPRACHPVILSRAEQLKCPLIRAEEKGAFFDEENSEIAQSALHLLKDQFTLTASSIHAGLKVRPACRFELREGVLFDVAHNPDAFCRLAQALETFFPEQRKRFIIGLCRDKDAKSCLKHLLSIASHFHLVEALTPRAAPPSHLENCLREEGFYAATSHPDISQGMKEALQLAKQSGELLVVCGSFYIIEEALKGR
jgi:dihydrofolate synthase/folylpolyglutamate synthase